MHETDSHRDTLVELKGAYKKDIEGLNRIEDKCPTCKQEVPEHWTKKRNRILSKGLVIVNRKLDTVDKVINKIEKIKDTAKKRLESITRKLDHFKQQLQSGQAKEEMLEEQFEKIQSRKKLQRKYKRQIAEQLSKISRLSSLIQALQYEQSLVSYGIKVYSKDGLPAFMIRSIVPHLNIAAEMYARLIGENEIKIKFAVEDDGAIDVSVNNKHGGEDLEAQSRGELRIASSITSFAVREVISPANVLFLDEPGEGLDAHNLKLFSRALKDIAKRFGTVFITSHNAAMLAELEGEKMICIEKKNRVARLVAA